MEDLIKKRINYLIKYFDFRRVQKVMTFLNWKWALDNGDTGVPEIKDLKNTAKRLLEDVSKQGGRIATGGFYAEYTDDRFDLKFCLDEIFEDYETDEELASILNEGKWDE